MRTIFIKRLLLLAALLSLYSCSHFLRKTEKDSEEKQEYYTPYDGVPENLKDVHIWALYQNLNMSQRQIDRFEKKFNHRMKKLRKKEYDADKKTVLQIRDETLLDILNANQYTIFLLWKKDHPGQ